MRVVSFGAVVGPVQISKEKSFGTYVQYFQLAPRIGAVQSTALRCAFCWVTVDAFYRVIL